VRYSRRSLARSRTKLPPNDQHTKFDLAINRRLANSHRPCSHAVNSVIKWEAMIVQKG
jgi:hypothetical protein